MSKHVVVLGAGFTRAFFPNAPLLVDDDPLRELLDKYAAFPAAVAALEPEVHARADGKVDLERVLTRLSSPMPYEAGTSASAELAVVLPEVQRVFMEKIRSATEASAKQVAVLNRFAEHCVTERITCVTFTYDEVVDHALLAANQGSWAGPPPQPYWHPDGGYAFFCPPSESVVTAPNSYMDHAEVRE